jgi:hypothetical protein
MVSFAQEMSSRRYHGYGFAKGRLKVVYYIPI